MNCMRKNNFLQPKNIVLFLSSFFHIILQGNPVERLEHGSFKLEKSISECLSRCIPSDKTSASVYLHNLDISYEFSEKSEKIVPLGIPYGFIFDENKETFFAVLAHCAAKGYRVSTEDIPLIPRLYAQWKTRSHFQEAQLLATAFIASCTIFNMLGKEHIQENLSEYANAATCSALFAAILINTNLIHNDFPYKISLSNSIKEEHLPNDKRIDLLYFYSVLLTMAIIKLYYKKNSPLFMVASFPLGIVTAIPLGILLLLANESASPIGLTNAS